MTTVYLLRHGETENPEDLIKGRLDRFALSPRGKKHLKRAARQLANERVTSVYTSPLLRARQSAEVFKESFPKAKFRVLEELNEWDSKLAGKPNAFIKSKPYSFFLKYYESPDQVLSRMRKALELMVGENRDGAAVAFSHGWPLTLLLLDLEGNKFKYPLTSFPHDRLSRIELGGKQKSPRILHFRF
ncbi:hypothetical protein GTO10_01650 [Candidatus Saccharibacteria bacterium]|nr:hypothetical protein [Candidatus Saccharibacteria bacterium]